MHQTISSYCLKCRKNIESKYRRVVKTKNRRIMFLLKFSVFNSKKSKSVLKEQEARGLWSSLMGVKILILIDFSIINALF